MEICPRREPSPEVGSWRPGQTQPENAGYLWERYHRQHPLLQSQLETACIFSKYTEAHAFNGCNFNVAMKTSKLTPHTITWVNLTKRNKRSKL